MKPARLPLVNLLNALLPLPPVALALAVAGVFALPLVVLAALQASDTAALHRLWRLAMAPAIVAFILAVHPRLQLRWRAVVDTLRPLSRQPALLDDAFAASRPGEAAALLIGTAIAAWISASIPVSGWLFAYVLATNAAMFGLMALSVHEGLRRTRQLGRIVAAGLAIDLFDRPLLAPLARFGQGVSLTFVGGICVSLLFQSAASLYSVQSLVIYAVLVGVALTLFFSSIWSVHTALVGAQQRELAAVRAHLARARAELRRRRELGGEPTGSDEAARLYAPLAAFGTCERQLLDASTWPFDPKVVKEVGASLLAPILIYGVKLAIGLSGQP